jgi:hypothetical protein
MLGWRRQAANGLAHRPVGGPKNIQRIDRGDILDRNCPAHVGSTRNLGEKLPPERGGQLLRVIEPGKPPVLEKNNRRSHDRACEWSAARFINAGDEKNAPLLESALVPE